MAGVSAAGGGGQASWLLAAALVLAGVAAVAPWKMVDPDALAHLATGRLVLEQGAVPRFDPLTFSAPDRVWSNPGWLGDVIWYGAFKLGGEPGLQAAKAGLLTLAWLLVLALARRRGAWPMLAAAVVLLLLPGLAWRFTLRNHLHALWLVPLYGLLLERARRRPMLALALAPLAVAWANLHGSFPVSWALVAAAAVQAVASGQRRLALVLGLVLAAHPLLALVSPLGCGNYLQLIDHVMHAQLYRQLIIEWRPPELGARMASLPLLVLVLLGLAACLPLANRPWRWDQLLLLLAGVGLALASRRFIPLAVVLTAPTVAAGLTGQLAAARPRLRRLLPPGALALGLVLLAPVAHALRTDARPALLRRGGAVELARFVGRHAPPGARLFNAYNSGPYLLWLAAPAGVRLYIDPRNNLGALALRRYAGVTVRRPRRFANEARRLGVTLAEVDRGAPRMLPLARYLARAPGWRRVYRRGQRALYAREVPANARLIARHAR